MSFTGLKSINLICIIILGQTSKVGSAGPLSEKFLGNLFIF